MFKILRKLKGKKSPVIVMPFGGYANDSLVHAEARVLEDEGISPTEKDSILKNLYHSYKRLESDEKAGETVKIYWGDNREKSFASNREGYIAMDEQYELEINNSSTYWFPLTFQLIRNSEVVHQVTSHALKPSKKAEFGVISDLDDTVLYTGVSSVFKWRVLVNSIFVNSHNRIPLAGAQKLYDLLHKGKSGDEENPFFYLSNSPWNLYDYLSDFLEKFDFPRGVLLLRDFSLKNKKSFLEGNKYTKILHILETYPEMSFLLIGDASEEDIDIYLHIAKNFPERIRAIYIRTVKRKSKMKRVEKLIQDYTDIDVILIKDGSKAIEHARANGWIY